MSGFKRFDCYQLDVPDDINIFCNIFRMANVGKKGQDYTHIYIFKTIFLRKTLGSNIILKKHVNFAAPKRLSTTYENAGKYY